MIGTTVMGVRGARPETNSSRARQDMRTLEGVIALVVALVAFAALKLIGLVLHIALVGAAVGLVLGLVLARAFRRP